MSASVEKVTTAILYCDCCRDTYFATHGSDLAILRLLAAQEGWALRFQKDKPDMLDICPDCAERKETT